MRAKPLPTRKEVLSERRRLRRKYKGLYDEVTRVVFAHDPIRIGSVPDEYEPEVARILPRAASARSTAELTDVIHSVFVEMFDSALAGPRTKYEAISRDLWDLLHRNRAVSRPDRRGSPN